MDFLIIILLTVLIIILLITYYLKFVLKKSYFSESFKNKKININIKPLHNNYLYPVCKLKNQCKVAGLKPAFSPTTCTKNGKIIPYANCACVDNNGICKICYPPDKKITDEAQIIYNDNIHMQYHSYSMKKMKPTTLYNINSEPTKKFRKLKGNLTDNEYEKLSNNARIRKNKIVF